MRRHEGNACSRFYQKVMGNLAVDTVPTNLVLTARAHNLVLHNAACKVDTLCYLADSYVA